MPTQNVVIRPPAGPNSRLVHLFDMDGTLIRSDKPLLLAWQTWAEKVGIPKGSQAWANVMVASRGRKVREFMSEYVQLHGSDKARASLSTPESLIVEEKSWFDSQVEPAARGVDGVEAIEGAREYFNSLVAAGRVHQDFRRSLGVDPGPIGVAIYTSTAPDIAFHRLKNAGFDLEGVVIIDVNAIAQGKPHPEGYLAAADGENSLIDNSVIYEDAKSGLVSGFRSGGFVVGLRSTKESEDVLRENSDVIVDSLAYVTLLTNSAVKCFNATLVEGHRLAQQVATPEHSFS